MNILSLFDGMSCGYLALQRAGIKIDSYYASEINKYAEKVSQKNFPEIIRLGDVEKWQDWKLPKIDLLIAGSPCQGFSRAGKGLNFSDPRSKLFFVFVDILRALKPKYFMLENVDMKAEWRDIISGYVGVQPIKINSALVSAQNRERLYWTNISGVNQPKDKGIILADIIEDGFASRQKDPNYAKGGIIKRYTKDSGRLIFGAAKRNQVTRKGVEAQLNIRADKKSNAVVRSYPKKLNGLVMVGMAGDINGHESIRRIYSPNGKAPTLTNMQGGHREPKISIIQRGRGNNKGGERAKNGKTPAMSKSSWQNNNHLFINGLTYRKLTVTECERLQTLPDGYTEGISNSRRYEMLGNGWTVDVIAHIFSYLNTKTKPKELFYFKQSAMFIEQDNHA